MVTSKEIIYYKKFIYSLDKKQIMNNIKNDINNDINNDDTTNDKQELKNTIKEIKNSYNNYFEQYEIIHKPYCDPNSYLSNKLKNKIKIPKLIISQNIKTKVDIECEIQSIEDLLKIIDAYPNNEEIEYNMNIAMLHKIKEPLKNLNNMIGMKQLKENIIDQLLFYIQNLHNFENQDFMHTVISGPPGTGKTEVAKIIGSIFSKLGMLKKGTFKKVTRSDLVAGYLGQTAIKTKEVINDCLGGVLFIDEAYSLGSSDKRDSFSKECIDTICEAASDYKRNLMIIIAGYENELNECFFSYNQGLSSRFVWRFHIDKYSGEDLYHIFLKKVEQEKWKTDESIKKEWFETKKDSFTYYGRDIEALFIKTKIAHSRRIFGKSIAERKNLTIKDLDKGFSIFLNNDELKKQKDKEKELFKNILQSMYV